MDVQVDHHCSCGLMTQPNDQDQIITFNSIGIVYTVQYSHTGKHLNKQQQQLTYLQQYSIVYNNTP